MKEYQDHTHYNFDVVSCIKEYYLYHLSSYFEDEDVQMKISKYLEPKDGKKGGRPVELSNNDPMTEAEVMASKFEDIFTNSYLYLQFSKFLETLYVVTDIQFLKEVHEYKMNEDKYWKTLADAKKIADKYLNNPSFEYIKDSGTIELALNNITGLDNIPLTERKRDTFETIERIIMQRLTKLWPEFSENLIVKTNATTTGKTSLVLKGLGVRETDHQFYGLMKNQDLYSEFLTYLRHHLAADDLLFWRAVHNYKQDPSWDEAEKIASVYFGYNPNGSNGQFKLFLDNTSLVDRLFESLDNEEVEPDLFDLILVDVQHHLSTTQWVQFCLSRTDKAEPPQDSIKRSLSGLRRKKSSRGKKKFSPRLKRSSSSSRSSASTPADHFVEIVSDQFLHDYFKSYLQTQFSSETIVFLKSVYELDPASERLEDEIRAIGRTFIGGGSQIPMLTLSYDILVEEFIENMKQRNLNISIFDPIIKDLKGNLKQQWNAFTADEKVAKRIEKYIKKRKHSPRIYDKLY
eukprot:TRINITY_DN8996_c0_g2_i1.p1 TRINITY_DN8996_c0_g2~~TRINITY_DN8996_c0_g2_i1.p1  ORF type:complete len:567 (-),score=106.92 TRINITY_DN8996_c0_g2_i1:1621-3171(-)